MAKPTRQLNKEVMDKLKGFEALRNHAYPDPASPLAKRTRSLRLQWGFRPAREILKNLERSHPELVKLSGTPWTCGYGSTRGVTPDTYWTKDEALVRLDQDLDDAQSAVERLVKVKLNDFQYGALTSLVFNIGSGNFSGSNLLKRLNEGKYEAAAARFDDWVKVRNQETGKLEFNQGLKNRRDVEKALFLRGSFVESNNIVPVEVTPDVEKPVAKDPGVAIPAVTTGAAGVLAIGEAASKLEPLAAHSETIRAVFVGLTLLGVVITLILNMQKRKEAKEKENAS